MAEQDIIDIVKQYRRAITNKFGRNKPYLFGSYAKGNFHAESDIDVAVVFKDYNKSTDMQLELMRLRRPIDIRIEPIPFREKEFEPSNPSPLKL